MKYYVVDTETCGLNPPAPPGSGVVQVAWAEICPTTLEILDVQSHLVNPQAPIHPEAAKVHGYTNADVDHLKPLEYSYAPVGPTVLICHNYPFDSKFLARYTENLAGKLCTLELARHLVRDSKNHKLATLAEHFKLEAGKAHDAGGDVRTTVQLLRILVEMSGRTLTQLVAANKAKNFHVMPFGKYKGFTLDKLPLGYLKWFIDQEIDGDLRYTLQQQLSIR
jgi:DNA polymerase III epsilon subunit-like protein